MSGNVTEPDPDGAAELALVMPFVNVRSVGGCYDDRAYAAGWELGDLDAQLRYEQPPVHERMIRVDNVEQADLVAMNHGYQVRTEDSGVEGWSYLRLTKVGDGRDE